MIPLDLLASEQERIARRPANQAFFDKLVVMPDDTVDGVVETKGIEPSTSALQRRRSTN